MRIVMRVKYSGSDYRDAALTVMVARVSWLKRVAASLAGEVHVLKAPPSGGKNGLQCPVLHGRLPRVGSGWCISRDLARAATASDGLALVFLDVLPHERLHRLSRSFLRVLPMLDLGLSSASEPCCTTWGEARPLPGDLCGEN
ncbi:hypothetical protein E2C01_013624 [Portunus trituberculatus]|uniref:Uncharacterized protein n=1 Tax=Portunus trituberculatus TaxID=210409 RepID=A0A5B7DH53_PORTR|nr:hypothetical protein [Portunus trituberculatus]